MIQIKDVEQICSRCKYTEKRLKYKKGLTTYYSIWKRSNFIDGMAKKGDKVRLAFTKPGTSYWIVDYSNIEKMRVVHPSTGESITMSQDPSTYQILVKHESIKKH